MKKQVATILAIILVIIIAVFSMMNLNQVAISFGFAKVQAPLIILMLVCVLFGALIIFLFSTAANLRKNRELKQLESDNNQKQAELKIEIQRLNQSLNDLENKLRNSTGKQALGLKEQQIDNLQSEIEELHKQLENYKQNEWFND